MRKFPAGQAGMSLVELVIAMSILSVAVVGFVSSFHYITRSIHVSRARTLASNLAQEKVENMKDVSYHKLQLSTETATDNNFSPALVYDVNNEAPETIVIGGMTFTRRTFVAFAEVDAASHEISTVTFNYPDTGMKELRVQVVWQERGSWKKMELENIYENPDIDPLNTVISGCVDTDATPDCSDGGIAGALVQVLGTDWKDTADGDGEYAISVHAGTYSVRASSTNYYSFTQNFIGASTGTTVTQDFTLTAIASGTVTGNAWLNTNLVISQIVTSTSTALITGGAYVDVEYVELFNPTTFTITLNDAGTHKVKLYYDRENGEGADCDDACFNLTYDTSTVDPGHYFLIASTKHFMVLGDWHLADATYGTLGSNRITNSDAGCLKLLDPANQAIDIVGWADDTGAPPYWTAPCYETLPIPETALSDGIGTGMQVVRVSSPLLTSDTVGRAYDSGNNALDFLYAVPGGFSGMIQFAPHDTSDAAQDVLAGKPATAAFVTANDLIGPSTSTVTLYVASGSLQLPYARFELSGISTGTWNILVSTGTEFSLIENVTVAASASTGVPNGATSPAWTRDGVVSAKLSSSSVEGYISGQIQDADNDPLSGITVNAAGQVKTTGANGTYFAQVSSGLITIVANPNNASAEYVESIKQVTIQTGIIAEQDFTLLQGGVVSGFVTTDGSSILPGIEITATRGGAQYGAATSDSSGYFYIKNLSTGTYTIKPALDASEVSSPVSFSSTVILNDTLFVGTFTITGAMGELAGTVELDGELVTSGALVLASTKPISSTPPLIVGSSAPAMTFIYAASSKADGTYTMDVRGSATDTYYVSAYIPDISGASVTVTTKTYSGIAVTASQTTSLTIEVP